MKILSMAVAVVAVCGLTACTTAEKTASGAGVGAVVGAAVSSNPVGGAAVGALIGGFGTFLVELADGQCQYRNSQGQVYTTKCHWLK